MLTDRVAIPREEPRRLYDPPHILWYFGAITAAFMASATVLSIDDSARGTWQLLIGLLFMAAFGVGALLLLQAGWRVPGGALVVTTVAMVPVVAQAFERLIGVWPSDAEDLLGLIQGEFQGAFFAIGLATIAAGLGAFALVRFPFAFSTVTVAIVFTAQLLVPVFVDDASLDDRASCFIVTGAVLVLVGFVLDSVRRGADAFWWHAVGLFTLGVGLGWYGFFRQDDWAWVAVLAIAAVLILASAPFNRATWATYGVIGVFAAMLNYVTDWFGTWAQPALMVVVSVGLILLGIALQLKGRVWAIRLNREPTDGIPPPTAPAPATSERSPAAPTPPVEAPPPEPEPPAEPPSEPQPGEEQPPESPEDEPPARPV